MNSMPHRHALPFDLSLPKGSGRVNLRRLLVVTAVVGALFFAPLLGIWQKNKVEDSFARNNVLRERISLLSDEVVREEIAIRQLSTFERIEPLAAARLGLGVMDPANKVYLPISPLPASEPQRFERELDAVVAAAHGGLDWILPGNDARAGD